MLTRWLTRSARPCKQDIHLTVEGEALLDHIAVNTLLQSEALSLAADAAGAKPPETTYLALAVGRPARYPPPLHQHAF
jgi:hypothetical protein